MNNDIKQLEAPMGVGLTVEELRAILPRMIRASGRLYMIAASMLVNQYGPEGEKAVRGWGTSKPCGFSARPAIVESADTINSP